MDGWIDGGRNGGRECFCWFKGEGRGERVILGEMR